MQKSSQGLVYHLMHSAISVARTGSPSRSARALGLSVTTVYRHLDALERSLGVQIFDRHHSSWTLREEASALLSAGEQIEQLLHHTENQIRLAAGVVSDRLRIAISQDLASHYIVPRLRDFCRNCKGVRPELIVASQFSDLTRGEADVAIRPHGDPGDSLIGRRVGSMFHAFYASRNFIKRKGAPPPLALYSSAHSDWCGQAICGFGQALSDYTSAQWLEEAVATDAISARFDCTEALTRAVVEGLGIGLLPCFVGDAISSLRPIAKIKNGLPVDIWLVTAAANRNRTTVKSFIKFFASNMRADKAKFTGVPYAG